jgi:hypothetical protein
MKTKKQKKSIRAILNKVVRIPQRTEITKLSTGVTTLTEVYKNKKIVLVSTPVSEIYNKKI